MYDPLPPADSETMYDIDERASFGSGAASYLGGAPTDPQSLVNMMRNLLTGNRLPPGSQEEVQRLLVELERLRTENANQAPGAFPDDGSQDDEYPELVQEMRDAAAEEGEQDEDDDLGHIEHEMLNNAGMTADEMMEIMNAVGDEDLEVQRALAEAFERNNR
ncbi:hypothetical protein G6F42_012650 [Rhizopus arrhizus]|nr:hypothetical protein G6F42_012650 [Rhizopus arrhizus]